MKFVIQTITIILVAYLLELFAPWYSIAIAAFGFGFSLKSKANFLAGFLTIVILGLFKMWITDINASENLNLAESGFKNTSLNR
jgi:hypothetical protein